MRIALFGGGNIGTAMAALLSREGHEVVLITPRAADFARAIVYTDRVNGESFSAPIFATADYSEIARAEIAFVTVPSFALSDVVEKIAPFWKKETPLGIVPGSGGGELLLSDFLSRGFTVFGLDRVPCISRVSEYGRSVAASKKDAVRLAAIPRAQSAALAATVGALLNLTCTPLDNYLTVTFTPSNPILHTARLYSLYFANEQHAYDENVLFYEAWDDASSRLLLACDGELQALCRKVEGLDLSGVVGLDVHYGVTDEASMTKKLSSIPSFFGILSPMVRSGDGKFVLDTESRYFSEDFPYGLLILVSFAHVFGLDVPEMRRVLTWFESLCGKEYLVDGKLIGRDLANLPIPQNFGLLSPEAVVEFYSR